MGRGTAERGGGAARSAGDVAASAGGVPPGCAGRPPPRLRRYSPICDRGDLESPQPRVRRGQQAVELAEGGTLRVPTPRGSAVARRAGQGRRAKRPLNRPSTMARPLAGRTPARKNDPLKTLAARQTPPPESAMYGRSAKRVRMSPALVARLTARMRCNCKPKISREAMMTVAITHHGRSSNHQNLYELGHAWCDPGRSTTSPPHAMTLRVARASSVRIRSALRVRRPLIRCQAGRAGVCLQPTLRRHFRRPLPSPQPSASSEYPAERTVRMGSVSSSRFMALRRRPM